MSLPKSTIALVNPSSPDETEASKDISGEVTKSNKNSSVSSLPPNTLRWINKRRPDGSHCRYITPSRAMHLRSIFRGLDFDDSGNISLKELKGAVAYVAKHDHGSKPIFEDPKKMNDFFDKMDLNKNGDIDFNEFLVAMTEQGSNDDDDTARLQLAFHDFANKHRRQTLIDRVKDKSIPDIEQLHNMHTLFTLQFVKKEVEHLTPEDRIKNFKREAEEERRELLLEQAAARRSDVTRSRTAKLFFETEQRNSQQDPFSLQRAFSRSGIKHVDQVSRGGDKRVLTRLTKFPLGDPGTYTPPLGMSRSASSLRLQALGEARSVKAHATWEDAQPPLLPPMSLQEDRVRRAHAMAAASHASSHSSFHASPHGPSPRSPKGATNGRSHS